MTDRRDARRVYADDYRDFEVHAFSLDHMLYGGLLDISETGFCAIVPADPQLAPDTLVCGAIFSPILAAPLAFEAHFRRAQPELLRDRFVWLAGFEFTGAIILPDQILAIDLARSA